MDLSLSFEQLLSGSACMSSPYQLGRNYRLAPLGTIVFDSSSKIPVINDRQRPAHYI